MDDIMKFLFYCKMAFQLFMAINVYKASLNLNFHTYEYVTRIDICTNSSHVFQFRTNISHICENIVQILL
jgi:hypothetical protein